jgi:hypothetical protein
MSGGSEGHSFRVSFPRGEDTVHLPRRLVSPSQPSPSIQLALDLNSRRAGRLGENHHLWRNGRLWWIAYTLLHDGWRQERIRHSLGTADLFEARHRRDVILAHWARREELVA